MTEHEMISRQRWAIRLLAAMAVIVATTGYFASELKESAIRAEAKADAYRDTIAMSSTAVVVVGSDSKVTDWSHGASDIFGYTRDEMIGNNLEKIIPVDMRPKHREAIARALAREKSDPQRRRVQVIKCVGLTKSGNRVPVMITTRMVRDDVGGGVVFSATVDRLSSVRELTIPTEG